jgi:rRNA maturation endonuclease Nob1
MKPVLFCHKCALAFPQLPPSAGFTCPQCGDALKIVRPLSKREVERFKLNLGLQKKAMLLVPEQTKEGK